MTPKQNLAEQLIEDVLKTWPETAVVFTRHNMACIGCNVSHLYTITEAAAVYELPVEEFVSELESAIGKDASTKQ
jgi:hybrid cluster-associated redox disulfide protein